MELATLNGIQVHPFGLLDGCDAEHLVANREPSPG